MTRLLFACLALGLCLSGSPHALWAFQEDGYGPACQWIRLQGRVARPSDLKPSQSLLLNVFYRLPEQKRPATLVVSYPVEADSFHLILSGFDEKIEKHIFLAPGFFFAKKIEFFYFVQSADGRWVSPTHTSVYEPNRKTQDGKKLCQTRLALEPLILHKRLSGSVRSRP